MTTVQRIAQIFGIGFVIVALAGFYSGGMTMESDHTLAPRALGLFPVNLLHNIVHLLFGLWGLAASRSWSSAKQYCQIAGIIYAVLIVAGFVAPDGFGFIPLGGTDIWLHVALALPLLYFGFTAKPETMPPAGSTI